MRRVAITGAAGFIGTHVVEHFMLNTKWRLVLLVRMSRAGDLNRLDEISRRFDDWDDRVQIVRHDLLDSLSPIHRHMGRLDYIVHMAAHSHVDYSISNPVEVLENNFLSTVNVLEYARVFQSGLKKFLYYSTDEVFGPAPLDYGFGEEDNLNPSNPYSAGKAAGEMAVTAYHVTYGMPTIISRTMNVIGERQDPEKFVPLIIQRLRSGEMIKVHGSKDYIGTRFYLHARNTADATMFLLESDLVGERVNVVGNEEVSNLGILQKVADVMGIEVVEGVHYELEDFHLQRPGHDRRYAMSGAKLAGLGWKPPLTLDESLRRTVEWTLENERWVQ